MRIDSKETILDISILEIRKLLRKGKDGLWGIDFVKHVLGIPDEQAGFLLVELEKRGFIEPAAVSEKARWTNTLNGNTLSLARANKPISRKTADRMMAELKERIAKVNREPYFLYKVGKVIIFGSYLTDSMTLNDIDIAIALLPKAVDKKQHRELCEQRSQFLAESGKNFGTFFEYLIAAEQEVYTTLKARSHHVSFHNIDDPILKTAQQKLMEID